jgi:hypothetical protein
MSARFVSSEEANDVRRLVLACSVCHTESSNANFIAIAHKICPIEIYVTSVQLKLSLLYGLSTA